MHESSLLTYSYGAFKGGDHRRSIALFDSHFEERYGIHAFNNVGITQSLCENQCWEYFIDRKLISSWNQELPLDLIWADIMELVPSSLYPRIIARLPVAVYAHFMGQLDRESEETLARMGADKLAELLRNQVVSGKIWKADYADYYSILPIVDTAFLQSVHLNPTSLRYQKMVLAAISYSSKDTFLNLPTESPDTVDSYRVRLFSGEMMRIEAVGISAMAFIQQWVSRHPKQARSITQSYHSLLASAAFSSLQLWAEELTNGWRPNSLLAEVETWIQETSQQLSRIEGVSK